MTDRLTIALAQLNPVVGKIDFNLNKLREVRAKAAKAGVDLVVTSELYSCGYPPEDLVRKPLFISEMTCLLYTSPSPRDGLLSRMPSSA